MAVLTEQTLSTLRPVYSNRVPNYPVMSWLLRKLKKIVLIMVTLLSWVLFLVLFQKVKHFLLPCFSFRSCTFFSHRVTGCTTTFTLVFTSQVFSNLYSSTQSIYLPEVTHCLILIPHNSHLLPSVLSCRCRKWTLLTSEKVLLFTRKAP